jgi:hypothetical protein
MQVVITKANCKIELKKGFVVECQNERNYVNH